MQAHPSKYLHKMIAESNVRIKQARAGGVKTPPTEESALTHQCVETRFTENIMANNIEVEDRI